MISRSIFQCPNGHCWGPEQSAEAVSATCPDCGSVGEPIASTLWGTEDEETTSLDELPPPPRSGAFAPAADHDASTGEVGASPGARGTRAAGPAADRLGQREGYRLLEVLGRGGMGVVYEAVQESLGRHVALKVMPPGSSDDPLRLRRFLLEAEITGGLEHPGIVPVHGLGADGDGRPFYTMKLVRGESFKAAIDAFHRESAGLADSERSIRLRQLLARFLDLCNAIAYAHSRGVLHRDLKPSNVMIGQFGETLIIDWGLAKATGDADSAGAATTAAPPQGGHEITTTGSAVGTPQFMSPEQSEGANEKIGPATDVYGLGAILFTLATGRPPIEGETVEEILGKVGRGEIAPTRRQGRRAIPAPLEAICLKAMARDPDDRYVSARALASDVERYLADEAISAFRDPPLTRLARWARRHRTLVASLLVLLITGLTAASIGLISIDRERARTAYQRDRADRWLDEAMAAMESYYTGVSERVVLGEKVSEDLRADLLEQPLVFYGRLSRELVSAPSDEPRAVALLVRGRTSLGRVLASLGRNEEALEELEAAFAAGEALVEGHPESAEYLDVLARCGRDFGDVLRDTGELAGAINRYRRAVAAGEALVDAQPGDPEHRYELVQCRTMLGIALDITGEPATAIKQYRLAIKDGEALVAEYPGVPKYRDAMAELHSVLGVALDITGELATAIEQYRLAIKDGEALVAEYPGVPEYRDAMAGALSNLGIVLRAVGDPEAAAESHRRAIASWRALVAERPNVPSYRNALARGHSNLAVVLEGEGDLAGSREQLRRAADLREALVAEHQDIPGFREGLAATYSNLGKTTLHAGDPDVAADLFRQAIDLREALVAEHPDLPEYRDSLASSLSNLAAVEAEVGQLTAATEHARRAVALREETYAEQPNRPEFRSRLAHSLGELARVLGSQGELGEAVATYREAVAHQRAVHDRSPRSVVVRGLLAGHYTGLASSLRALGHAEDAAEAARQVCSLWPDDPSRLYDAARAMSLCVPLASTPAQADSLAAEAVAILRLAIANGWSDPTRAALDPDLEPLRGRVDFERSLADLFDRVFPSDPFAR